MEASVRKVALVAHDNMKKDMAEWVYYNAEALSEHSLVCTGTTGKMVKMELERYRMEHLDAPAALDQLEVKRLKSGPLGGDQQLGSMIAEGEITALIFFWDPMSAQPHDVDVKALLRLATLYNVPTAINRATADFMISSPLFKVGNYVPEVKDYKAYVERVLE